MTPIYNLTEWAAAQSEPWVPHNVALRALEAVGRKSVLDRDLADAPAICVDGATYLVAAGSTPADPWDGQAGKLAIAVGADAANGWIFVPIATAGQILWVEDESLRIEFVGGGWSAFVGGGGGTVSLTLALSDLTSDLAAGVSQGYWDPPFPITIQSVSAAVFEAPTGSGIQVDINEEGATVLSTKITIDATELRSVDSATPPVVSDTAITGRLTFDIDAVGSTLPGKGLQVTIEYVAA